MRSYSTAPAEQYREKGREIQAVKRRQRRREAEQLAAKARLGCDYCLAPKHVIQGEQHRMKAETMARHPEWFS